MVDFIFSQAQIDRITILQGERNYAAAYRYAADCADGQPGADQQSVVWLRGSAEVNENNKNSPYSKFIRSYTKAQLEQRYSPSQLNNLLAGKDVDKAVSDASNLIADTVLTQIVFSGKLPSISSIAADDAGPAAKTLFGGDLGGWAGNPLFIALGVDFPYNENILGDPSNPYNAVAMLSALEAGPGVFSGLVAGINSVIDNPTLQSVSAAKVIGDGLYEFLKSAYGSNFSDEIGNDLALLVPTSRVGYLNEDDDIEGTDANDLVIAGNANDTVDGSSGDDILDGGAGKNTISYEKLNYGIEYKSYTTTSIIRFSAKVKKDDNSDYLYRFQNVVGTPKNDTFTILSGSNAPESIDGGGGDDTISYSKSGSIGAAPNVDSDDEVAAVSLLIDFNASGNSSIKAGLTTSSEKIFQEKIKGVNHFVLSDGKDTVTISGTLTSNVSPYPLQVAGLGDFKIPTYIPTEDILIDGGTQVFGSGDEIDFTSFKNAKPISETFGGEVLASFAGVVLTNDKLESTGLSFENFEILKGTQENDYVVGDHGLKQIGLGDGNDVVGNLVGGVLPGQEKTANNKWVHVNLGAGADTVLGGLAPGSEVDLGLADGAVDKVLNVMNDVRINQAGTEDQIYIDDGTIQLHGGYRNETDESPWAHDKNGVRYGIDKAGELQINYHGSTMYVSNFQGSLVQKQATAGLLIFEYKIEAYNILAPKPSHDSLGEWKIGLGYMWKANYGYSLWKGVDPLVLDLYGKGIVTTAPPDVGSDGTGYGVRFDMNGNGFTVPTGWISENDAFVVRDLNGNGKIDDIHEMIGQGTAPGFQTLASYDYNGDGKVDASDWFDTNGNGVRDAGEGAFDVLRIWRDANGNGSTDSGELMTFAEAGIQSIDVSSTRLANTFDSGNQILGAGTFTRTDGSSGAAEDVAFATSNYSSTWSPTTMPIISPRIAAMPQVAGHGSLTDLRDAMALDEQAADTTQAAQTALTGQSAPRRETLADLIGRVGPTLTNPTLSTLRTGAAPILEAWSRTAPYAAPANTPATAVDGAKTVLDFIIHHAGAPDEQIDYAYEVNAAVTDTDGSVSQLTYWKLGSGAAIRDAAGNVVDHPDIGAVLQFAPAQGGVWQAVDGQGRDLAPLSPRNSIQIFVSTNGGLTTIQDYAYFVVDSSQSSAAVGSDGGYWALASGEPITDASGQVITHPSYNDLLAFAPRAAYGSSSIQEDDPTVAGGATTGYWTSPANAGLNSDGTLRLLVRHNSDGTDSVVDYAKSITVMRVLNDAVVTQTYWMLGSGTPVRDGGGNVIDQPSLAQAEAFRQAPGEEWQQFQLPSLETSTLVPNQGVTLFVSSDGNGSTHVVDYAYAVTETIADPTSVYGYQQITSWRLGSGAVVRNAAGQAIARPTFDQITAFEPSANGSWEHFAGATITPGVSQASSGQMILFKQRGLDGLEHVVDVATLVTETDLVDGTNGLSEQSQTRWVLASGNIIDDGHGHLISAPSITQIEAYAQAQGDAAELYDGVNFTASTPPSHSGVTVFIRHVDGMADQVTDYAYEVTETIVSPLDTQQPLTINYWKLGSGASVTDAQGHVIGHPTLDQVLAYAPSSDGAWEHFDGAYIKFLEDYMGDKIAIDLPGVVAKESFSDFTSAFNTILGRIDEVSVRIAVQTGLKSFFEDVAYDPTTDTFSPTTDQQLTPTFAAILSATDGMDTAQEASFLKRWKAILDVVIADYSRGTGGANNFGFLFSNIASAFQQVGNTTSLGLKDTAEALGIPQNLVIDRPGDIVGTRDPDIIYLNYGDQNAAGGAGLDNYVMGNNFGHDTIDDIEIAGRDTAYNDVLRFTTDNVDDLKMTRDGLDLIIDVKGRDDQSIVISNEFAVRNLPGLFGGNYADNQGIAEFVFADGTVWDTIDIARAVSNVTPVNGVIDGTPTDDVLNGGPGSDYVLHGGDDSDIYIWGRGYGNDTVDDHPSNVANLGINSVEFTSDVSPDDVTFTRDKNSKDAVVHIKGQETTLTITGQFDAFDTIVLGVAAPNEVGSFYFTDGSSISISAQEIKDQILNKSETSGDDQIYGYYGSDTLDGKGGNDYLSGGEGNDTYVYDIGYGHDTINTNIGNFLADHVDTVSFGPGITSADLKLSRPIGTKDLLIDVPNSGGLLIKNQFDAFSTVFGTIHPNQISYFTFSDGTQISAPKIEAELQAQQSARSNVELVGSSRPTVFDDSHGNVTMEGDDVANTYVFGRGYGHDTIIQNAEGDVIDGGDGTTVRFGAGISRSDLKLLAHRNDLIIGIKGTDDQLTIKGTLQYEYGTSQEIPNFYFADGSSISLSEIEQDLLTQEMASGDESIHGFRFNDVLIAGNKDELLSGGVGNDTYIYTQASGNVSINDDVYLAYADSSTDDHLELRDFSVSQVRFARDENDLIIEIVPTQKTIRLAAEFGSTANAATIEHFDFADGSVLSVQDIEQKVLWNEANNGSTQIEGFRDTTTFDVGPGNKYIAASGGSPSYVYRSSYGNDTIDNKGIESGTLSLTNIVSADVKVARIPASDSLVLLLSTGQEITLVGQAAGNGVGTISFSDGVSWSAGQILQVADASLVQYITGTDGNDTFVAGTLPSLLAGGDGLDTYIYSRASASDTINSYGGGEHESAWKRTLSFSDLLPSDLAFRSNGSDVFVDILSTGRTLTLANQFDNFHEVTIGTFRFADGTIWTSDDLAHAVERDETASDATSVKGFGANDILDAGLGDRVVSGGGQEYLYHRNSGNVTIAPRSGSYYAIGSRTLIFDDLDISDVAFEKLGNSTDLIIKIISTGREITLTDEFGYFQHDGIGNIVFQDGTKLGFQDIIEKTNDSASLESKTKIFGYWGDDTLDAGLGDKQLTANGGDDVFIYSAAGGNDTFSLDASNVKINLRGILAEDVSFTKSDNDLLIHVNTSGKSIELDNLLSKGGLKDIQFDNGLDVSAALIEGELPTTLTGSSGDDVLTAQTVDTTAFGMGGSDEYDYQSADGNLIIDNSPAVNKGILRLKDIGQSDISLMRSLNTTDLAVRILSTGKTITVKNQFDPWNWGGVESILLDDGSVLIRDDIAKQTDEVLATGDVGGVLNGNSGRDTLLGGAGDDTLIAGDGTGILAGGAGNNSLVDRFQHLVPTFDGGNDAVGVCRPAEWLWVGIGLGEKSIDGGLQVHDRAEDTAFQPAAGQLGKEAFDGV